MSTELISSAKGIKLTRFWGGDDRGHCVVVASDFSNAIQLTRKEAEVVAADLRDFALGREAELSC